MVTEKEMVITSNCNSNCNLCNEHAITQLLTIEATTYQSMKKTVCWILFAYLFFKLVLQHSCKSPVIL